MSVIAFDLERRSRLASFDNAYAVAVQTREASGVDQFIVRTDDPLQPYRVTRDRPLDGDRVLAMVA